MSTRGNETRYVYWKAKLRQVLGEKFSEADIQVLCFDLGVDFDSIPGNHKDQKVVNLIQQMSRLGRIVELIDRCSEMRPNVPWDQLRIAASATTDGFQKELLVGQVHPRELSKPRPTTVFLVLATSIGLVLVTALALSRLSPTSLTPAKEPLQQSSVVGTAVLTSTATNKVTISRTPTEMPPISATPPVTNVPTVMPTATASPTAIATPTATATPTAIPIATARPIATPTGTPQVVHLSSFASNAIWQTGALATDGLSTQNPKNIPYGSGRNTVNDGSGFAGEITELLEDGTQPRSLFTHPPYLNNSTIKGYLGNNGLISLSSRARLQGKVGFKDGAGAKGTDGVTFKIWVRYFVSGVDQYELAYSGSKKYSGALSEFDIDLSQWSGKQVYFELQVDSGPTSSNDWAIWLDPRVILAQ